MKYVLPVLALVLAAGGIAFLLFGGDKPVVENTLGAAGQNDSFRHFFGDDAIIGGKTLATSSAGAATYTAADFNNVKLIEHNATAALTVTLPTNALLSSAGFLPYQGDTATRYIHASTTLITLAGGTGVDVLSASTTKNISANATGELTCVRLGATEAKKIQCTLVSD